MNPLEDLLAKLNDFTPELWEPERHFKRNEMIKKGGAKDHYVYWIKSGSLRAYIVDESEELTIRLGYQGNFIGALDSFFTGKPSPLYLQALKATTLIPISKDNFECFINSDVENMKLWNEILKGLVVQQMEREQDILISSPQERLNRVLERSPQLFQEIPLKYIAAYLRMTPETLSRLQKS